MRIIRTALGTPHVLTTRSRSIVHWDYIMVFWMATFPQNLYFSACYVPTTWLDTFDTLHNLSSLMQATEDMHVQNTLRIYIATCPGSQFSLINQTTWNSSSVLLTTANLMASASASLTALSSAPVQRRSLKWRPCNWVFRKMNSLKKV